MASEIFEGEELFLVEGTLQEVQRSRTTVNLLEQIEKRAKAKALATGAAAAVSDMHGMLASSAMVALYDGEDMYNFAGLLSDEVICGTFEAGNSFKDGDRIKAVVSRRESVLYAHAVIRENDQVLFMPLTTFAGRRAHFRRCLREAWRMCFFGWLFLGIALWIITFDSAESLSSKLKFFGFCASLAPLIAFPLEFWTYHSTRYLGYRASAIFRVLGFPRPDDLDLLGAIHSPKFDDPNPAKGSTYNYLVALREHAQRYGLPVAPA